jgi:hypothetical protein
MEKPVDGPRERDQTVERLLRQSLETPQRAGVTDSCLDAETLAAWADGGLSGAALEAAQLHVADCARCQDLVGTLARINSTVPPTEPARASRRWLAWLVPLTAAAAAVALWAALPDRNARVSQAPQVQNTANLPPTPQATPAPPATGVQEAPVRRNDALQQPGLLAGAATKEVASSDATKDKGEVARNGVAGRLEADNLKKAAEPPAAPAAPVAAAAPAPSALPERAGGLTRSAARAADVAATEIVSPDPSVRWRILGAAVQHSANGGSTWEAASTGVAAEITAGAAPSASVCWLVGRGGVVLLTTDGRTWRRVAFPEMTDLSAVRATDAGGRAASVSTADGRTFSTTDGGVTWVSR